MRFGKILEQYNLCEDHLGNYGNCTYIGFRWPEVWKKLCAHPRWRNNNCVRATYLEFFNSIWLVGNDIILGVISGYLLYIYTPQVIEFFDWAHDMYVALQF